MPDRQNPDRSVRVWFRLIRLEARMQAAVGERLREIGVSIPQCDVLTTLTEQEGVSQQELATRLYVTKGNISGLIDRLAEAGLVERRSTPRPSPARDPSHRGRPPMARGDRRPAPLDRLDVGRMAERPRGAGSSSSPCGHRARARRRRGGEGLRGGVPSPFASDAQQLQRDNKRESRSATG